MRLLAWTALLIMGTLSATAGYMFVDRAYPIEYKEIKVLTPEVPVDGELKVLYHLERKKFCSTIVQRWIFDYNNYRFTLETKASMAPGPLGEDTFVVKVPLPEGISIGEARYRVILVYECNPVQKLWPLVQPLTDMPFRVVAR